MQLKILFLVVVLFGAGGLEKVFAQSELERARKNLERAGRDINKTAIKAGDDLSETAKKAEKDTRRELKAAGKGINHFGKEVEREFCDFFTAGRASRGEAGCGVSAGVGRDSEGVYTYDPQNPDEKFRPSQQQGVKNAELQDFAEFVHSQRIRIWELKDNDFHGIRRFLLPDYTLGEPWPNMEREVAAPTKTGAIRGAGPQGSGEFLAPRQRKDGGVRFHAGIDYTTTVGEPIYSPISGTIVRVKAPRPGLLGLLIRNDRGYTASVFYVRPTPDILSALRKVTRDSQALRVVAGQTEIGRAQDLHKVYPRSVPQHVHVTLEDPKGRVVAPNGRVRITKAPSGPK